MAGLEIIKIIREHHALDKAADGQTYGQMVDAAIAHALESDAELQDISLHFESEDWHELRAMWDDGRIRLSGKTKGGKSHAI